MKKKSRLDCETTKAATLIAAGGGRLPGAAKGWPAEPAKAAACRDAQSKLARQQSCKSCATIGLTIVWQLWWDNGFVKCLESALEK